MTPEEKIEKALEIIWEHSQVDGGHHKAWCIDQVVRVLVDDYDTWINHYMLGEDGPGTYTWDEGIAP